MTCTQLYPGGTVNGAGTRYDLVQSGDGGFWLALRLAFQVASDIRVGPAFRSHNGKDHSVGSEVSQASGSPASLARRGGAGPARFQGLKPHGYLRLIAYACWSVGR